MLYSVGLLQLKQMEEEIVEKQKEMRKIPGAEQMTDDKETALTEVKPQPTKLSQPKMSILAALRCDMRARLIVCLSALVHSCTSVRPSVHVCVILCISVCVRTSVCTPSCEDREPSRYPRVGKVATNVSPQ